MQCITGNDKSSMKDRLPQLPACGRVECNRSITFFSRKTTAENQYRVIVFDYTSNRVLHMCQAFREEDGIEPN